MVTVQNLGFMLVLLCVTASISLVSGDCSDATAQDCERSCNFSVITDWFNQYLQSNHQTPLTPTVCKAATDCYTCYTTNGCTIPTEYQIGYQQVQSACVSSISTTQSTTCTDSAQQNCYTSCNFDALTQWINQYKQNSQTQVTPTFCKARADCYTCFKSIGCDIPSDYEIIYLLTQSPCVGGISTTSTTCTDSAQQSCYSNCNYNVLTQWINQYLQNFQVPPATPDFCKARTDCYTCFTSIGCTIPPDYQTIYQLTQSLCATTCTNSAIQNCYNTCNFNAITQWLNQYQHNSQTPLTPAVCKARSDCYNCLTSIHCSIDSNYQNLYLQSQNPCAQLSSSTCTDGGVRNCQDNCNFNVIQQWISAYIKNNQTPTNSAVCKARTDCYNCVTSLGCTLTDTYSIFYQQTLSKCAGGGGNSRPNSAQKCHNSIFSLSFIALILSILLQMHN